ncbi:MAG: MBG domain-containing protein, partial [Paludibacter sp.]
KAVQTITFADLPTCTYGGAALTLTATSSSGIPVTYESSDYNVATPSGNIITLGNAGQCYITASVAGNGNYLTGTPVQKLLTVSKANQTITFDAIPDKTYGDAAFSLSASANTSLPVTFSSSIPAKLIISGTTATIAGAGTYTVTATQAGTGNYNSATTTRTFTINKATLTATADNKTRVYGDANPAFTVSYSGFVNADTKYELAAQPTASTTATATSNVGDYSVTLSAITDANYSLVYRNGTMSITQAPLMVTAQAASKIYGDANPTFALNYSGFKNNETSAVLTSLPGASTVAKTMSNVGTYDITASGGSAANYILNFTNGQLTINKATLKVYAADASRVYGESNPIFGLIITGYKGSDDISVVSTFPTASCSAIATSPVGTYNITYSGATADNYQFDYATTVGKLTVTKAALMVTADSQSKEYGNANPTLTYSYSGFKNSETASALTTLPTITSTALIASNVGLYDITVNGGSATNYLLSYTGAKLTISKAPLIISAKNDSINKGATIPTFTLVYSGFKGSDNATKLDVLPSVSCAATSSSAIGKYDIVLQGGSDKNYTYTLNNGVLTIKDNTGIYNVNDYNTKLYPVPATDKIFIQSDITISKAEIYSVNGQLMQIKAGHDLKSLDVSGLIKGCYTIRLFSDDKEVITRMIMKK